MQIRVASPTVTVQEKETSPTAMLPDGKKRLGSDIEETRRNATTVPTKRPNRRPDGLVLILATAVTRRPSSPQLKEKWVTRNPEHEGETSHHRRKRLKEEQKFRTSGQTIRAVLATELEGTFDEDI